MGEVPPLGGSNKPRSIHYSSIISREPAKGERAHTHTREPATRNHASGVSSVVLFCSPRFWRTVHLSFSLFTPCAALLSPCFLFVLLQHHCNVFFLSFSLYSVLFSFQSCLRSYILTGNQMALHTVHSALYKVSFANKQKEGGVVRWERSGWRGDLALLSHAKV